MLSSDHILVVVLLSPGLAGDSWHGPLLCPQTLKMGGQGFHQQPLTSLTIWCCWTVLFSLNSSDSILISYIAPQPPKTESRHLSYQMAQQPQGTGEWQERTFPTAFSERVQIKATSSCLTTASWQAALTQMYLSFCKASRLPTPVKCGQERGSTRPGEHREAEHSLLVSQRRRLVGRVTSGVHFPQVQTS